MQMISLMAESKEELKSLGDENKTESEKAGLKVNIHKAKIMASGPITLRQMEEEKLEPVTHFTFLSSKVTADCDGSHEINRFLQLGRKAMSNLDRLLKCRDVILPAKVRMVKAMVFPE